MDTAIALQRQKRRYCATLAAAAAGICIGAKTAAGDTIVNSGWSATNGNWSDAADWSPNSFAPNDGTPAGTDYNAYITSGTVTLDTNPEILSLYLASGTLTGGNHTLTVDGTTTWDDESQFGSAGAALTLNANGGMLIKASYYPYIYFYGGTINNGGLATVQPALTEIYASGTGTAGGNTTFNNLSGATFNAQGNFTYHGKGNTSGTSFPDVFSNAGTFEQTGGTGNTTFYSEFNNSGTVLVQSGSLLLNGGGTETGNFIVNSSETLWFLDGNYTFDAGAGIGGSGTIRISGTTFNTGSSLGGTGSIIFDGPATFNAGSTFNPTGPISVKGFVSLSAPLTTTSLTLSGGGKLTSSASITDNGTLTLTSTGIIAGDGLVLNSSGVVNWSNSGQFGTSGIASTMNANGVLTIAGPYAFFAGGTINNAGTATATPSLTHIDAYAFGTSAGAGGTLFNNLAGATFNVQGNFTYDGNGSASSNPDLFSNAGTFEQTGGNGLTTFNVAFNNSGSVLVQSGTLLLAGGGSATGSFMTSSGDTLEFGSNLNQYTFNSGSSVGGAGNITLGTVYGTGAITFNSGSSLGGAGNINIPGGTVTFNSGSTINSTGSISITTGGTMLLSTPLAANNLMIENGTLSSSSSITSSGTLTLDFGTITGNGLVLTSNGTLNWSDVGKFGSFGTAPTLNVNGAMNLSNAGEYNHIYFISGTINNGDTVTATPSMSWIEADGKTTFNNEVGAVFNAQVGFVYDGLGSGSVYSDMFSNAGTYEQMGGGTALFYAAFNNSGSVLLQGGSLELAGGGTETGNFTINSGQGLSFGGGLFAFGGGATVGGAGSFLVTSGKVSLNSANIFSNLTGSVSIIGGTVTLNAPQTVNSLMIGPKGSLDLAQTRLMINYGSGVDPIASIAAWIASGYAGGTWTGTGIMSTAAQANSLSYGIGYADSADPGNPANLPSGTIEIMYTLLGDANLDGAVNGTDFAILATNFNKAVSGWDQGDFNYDGAVNGADFAFLAANFNKGANQSANVTALDSFAAANGLMADVPEPATAALMVVAGLGILRRRRRSSASGALSVGMRLA